MQEQKNTKRLVQDPLTGDRAIVESGFPPLFTEVMTFIAMTMGVNVVLRVGNPPRIGFGDDAKPMGVKQNTGAAFLFKGLIPLESAFLKEKSEHVQIKIKNSDPEMTYPEYYGSSQLRVSLSEILSDSSSYERIEEKDGKLYLYPKLSVVDAHPENFKDAEAVKNTVFIVDLNDRQEPLIDQAKLLSQLPKNKSQLENIAKPSWWKPGFPDFSDVKHMSMPVSSCSQAALEQNQEPTPFLVLGGSNAQGPRGADQRAITGDVDLFWVVSQAEAITREIPDSGKKFDLSNLNERREFTRVYTEVVALMQEKVLGQQSASISLSDLKIEGYTNPSEAAMIYMVNTMFGAEGVKIAQLIQHGSEVYNPGKPSEIGPLLHVLPTGERVLTRNEDQLISLVMDQQFLATYPIDVHPKWNMEKWAPVVEEKINLKQPVHSETMKAYQDYKLTVKSTPMADLGKIVSGAIEGLMSRSRSNSVVGTPAGTPEGTPKMLRKRGNTLSDSNRERALAESGDKSKTVGVVKSPSPNRPKWTNQGRTMAERNQQSTTPEEKPKSRSSTFSPKI